LAANASVEITLKLLSLEAKPNPPHGRGSAFTAKAKLSHDTPIREVRGADAISRPEIRAEG